MSNETVFRMRGIDKAYGTTKVLSGIDLDIRSGEVIGLIGENGAGKSTLMKIIMGLEQPTEGLMEMNGQPYTVHSILEAGAHGIGMVFQEQSLILNLTVAQNIFLGREKPYKRGGLIHWKQMNGDAKTALDRLSIGGMVKPAQLVSNLTFATRQMVEIAKVLDIIQSSNAEHQILLLDEPTTVLSDDEIRLLMAQVRTLKQQGVSVVFISHRLDEVMEITDRIVVLRDGETVGTYDTAQVNTHILYEKMVGRATSGEYYFTDRQTQPTDEVVLEVKDLCQYGYFKDVSFALRRGEVLGLCGVEGSGKEEVCGSICGDLAYTSGTVRIGDTWFNQISSPATAMRHQLMAIPKERREEGMAGMLSVADNIALSSLKRVSARGIIQRKRVEALAQSWVTKMGIKCDGVRQRVDRLSGGNAQKVIFARIMNSGCDILILNHPTRGVDVGAKRDIYQTIREMTDSGKAVILLGDTLDECIGLSSRIIVMKDGVIASEIACDQGARPNQLDIVRHMM